MAVIDFNSLIDFGQNAFMATSKGLANVPAPAVGSLNGVIANLAISEL